MWIKYGVGAFCALAGMVFLAINSNILARGAARWALSDWDKLSYGAVAATVPWVIAIMPFLIVASLKPGRRMGRPSLWTIVGCGIWLAFAAYNLLGAGGAISLTRSDVVSSRKHDASAQSSAADRRAKLAQQRDAIPSSTRPAELIKPLVAAQKASPWWGYTESCREPSNTRERKFCGELSKLESELGAALMLADLTKQIEALDGRFEQSGPVAEIIDPQARFIATVTGLREQQVQDWLPLATPIVLELGSMTLLGFAFMLFGLNHRELLGKSDAMQDVAHYAVGVPAPPTTSHFAPVPNVTRQQQLAVWFFGQCVRPVAEGSLPESVWYQHYKEVCARSNDVPMPLESFRRVALKYVPTIKPVDGQVYYLGVLPLIPARAA